MQKEGVILVLTHATFTKHMTTRPKWNAGCTRETQGSWGIDAQLLQSTGAGVASVRVRGCAKGGGEPCTHPCHFHETHDNAAKTESHVQ